MDGGEVIAKVLVKHGVKFLFTLSGGHIAPIFVAAKHAGIRIIDVRHEVNAVFAADALARISGVPGVAVVTAGPGLTNTITAVKNAQLAQSPIIVLGGATATVLKGRGALQDIDQMALMKPHVKWAASVKKLKDFVPLLEKAFTNCQEGVPGPVFLECPVDLLYPEHIVREWYLKDGKSPRNFQERILQWYLNRHLNKIFDEKFSISINQNQEKIFIPTHSESQLLETLNYLKKAKRPLFVIGSQAMSQPQEAKNIATAVNKLGVPVYLSGMARGLLGKDCILQMRHNRREALKEADLVLLAGVACDFRLDYGRHIRSNVVYISVNRSKKDLYLNKKPRLAVYAEAGNFLIALAKLLNEKQLDYSNWIKQLSEQDNKREQKIDEQALEELDAINPVALFRELDKQLIDESVLIADGGDFVATASYTLSPRTPLSWLDPGVFGTLGVGGGFALGAKLARPNSEVWIIWGDGSSAYSLAEYDTFVRHKIPIIGLIGNDACWSQIARDQITILKDDVAAMLAYSDYHVVAKGFGGEGVSINKVSELKSAILQAREVNVQGKPFLINAIIGKSDFRKGSISI